MSAFGTSESKGVLNSPRLTLIYVINPQSGNPTSIAVWDYRS